MRSTMDWLSQLLRIISVTGELEIRCTYGAPWRISYEQSGVGEIPYHVVLKGSATLEDPDNGPPRQLKAGDIVLLSHGSAHVLHDGSGLPPTPASIRESANFTLSENAGTGEQLDMLCGRFLINTPHDRLIRDYLPATLVVRATRSKPDRHSPSAAADQLMGLVQLMRFEASEDRLGGFAMLNTLSSALFAFTLRAASESQQAPRGLLSLAANPRLAPAISAMLNDPAKSWTLPDLAQCCNMSRATFMRHFEAMLGRSAHDFLTDIRMSLAANALRDPSISTESIADLTGYQSIAAFRRTFTQRMGVTPGAWRRVAHQSD